MRELASKTDLLVFTAEGDPPTAYDIEFRCRGLCLIERDGRYQPTISEDHRCTIFLGPEFPERAPILEWRTPIFHPNIRENSVCLGNHWYRGWSIAAMCVELCKMVQYQSFNIQDPLDRDAAGWVAGAMLAGTSFPVDTRPMIPPDFDIQLASRT